MKKGMKQLYLFKNILWALAIAASLLALFVGIVIAAFSRNYSAREDRTFDLSGVSIVDEGTAQTVDEGASVSGYSVSGTYNVLGETEDAGEDYLNSLSYLVDSSMIAIRDLNMLSAKNIWGSSSGTLAMNSITTWNVVYSDGTKLSPDNAVMITKPEVLVIFIGNDGLTNVTEDVFIAGYTSLVSNIQKMSPDTKIICCSVFPVAADYSGSDGVTSVMTQTATAWVQQICADTGAYFCDTASAVASGGDLSSQFAESDGKTLNTAGIQQVLTYLRTHSVG